MKIKNLFIGFALLLSLLSVAVAFQKPNFSGKWEMDKARSYSSAALDQSATITQTGDEIKFDTKVKTARGEQMVVETYALNGKGAEFKPTAPPNATGKRTASWLPNGRGILIVDETMVDGKVVTTVTRKWTLAAGGKSFTVDYFIDNANGSFESKRVFNKVE